jgi:hypothetical protein
MHMRGSGMEKEVEICATHITDNPSARAPLQRNAFFCNGALALGFVGYVCSTNLLSLIFPPTVYHEHVLLSLLLGNKTHLVCGSCKHKLEHVQTCFGTWVCLTQHPNYMLWPFQELNYWTLYNETVYKVFIDFKKAHDSGRREVLYNILREFGVLAKLLRWIKMCLNETCSKVWIGKHLSDTFRTQIGLKQRDTLSPLLFTFVLEYVFSLAILLPTGVLLPCVGNHFFTSLLFFCWAPVSSNCGCLQQLKVWVRKGR